MLKNSDKIINIGLVIIAIIFIIIGLSLRVRILGYTGYYWSTDRSAIGATGFISYLSSIMSFFFLSSVIIVLFVINRITNKINK